MKLAVPDSSVPHSLVKVRCHGRVSGEAYDEKKAFAITAPRLKRMAEKWGGQENPNVSAHIFLPETLTNSPGTTPGKPNRLRLADGCAAELR